MKYTALWLEDDHTEIPRGVERICCRLDVDIRFASTIHAAEKIIQSECIDIFLLDIEIADERMTGIEFARQLRSSYKYHKAPIVFVSGYSHLARHLFASIPNCQLITKPYDAQQLENVLGCVLGIYEYVQKADRNISLLFPIKREKAVEVNAQTICYIEFLKNNEVCIQRNDGQKMKLFCQRGVRKYIFEQLQERHVSHLVQIYRSVIVNIHEIKSVKIEGREGFVYLFGDTNPQPLGVCYRDNIKNFL